MKAYLVTYANLWLGGHDVVFAENEQQARDYFLADKPEKAGEIYDVKAVGEVKPGAVITVFDGNY